ncbi:Fc receptor-like protein 3 [Thomomys bottae]
MYEILASTRPGAPSSLPPQPSKYKERHIITFPKTSAFTISKSFGHPVLRVKPSRPIEGSFVTLTCELPHPPQESHKQHQFCFFRNGQLLESGCSSSPELQIPTMWKEDSGSYWCEVEVEAHRIRRRSFVSQIHVQRVPVSDVSLETQPPGGWVTEGDKLILICLVANGSGDITFFWYRGMLGVNLKTKTQRSRRAQYEILTVRESDAELYYCAADNGYGPRLSGLVPVTVRIPVSHLVLSLSIPEGQAMVGTMVELHCEAQRGSPPILYHFYHEDVIVWSSLVQSGRGASFNFSLSAEHSGNYFCEADNGPEAQRSEVVTLNVTGPVESSVYHLSSGVLEGLLGSLGPITVALLFCYWLKRKIGRRSEDPVRSPSSPVTQEHSCLNLPASGQLDPIYENVNVSSGDDVYSLVYQIQQEQEPATGNRPWTHADIYSKLRKANVVDVDYDDTIFTGNQKLCDFELLQKNCQGNLQLQIWVLLCLVTYFHCFLPCTGIPPRAVLLLHPPLSTTFKGESVTLTCMDSLSLVQGPITWFLDSHVWKNEPNSITITKSGHYQCKTERSSISEPVHVKFLSDEVILQASPQPIFEGDNVFLKCQRKGGQLNSIFFKDGKKLESNNSDTIKLYSVLRDNSKYSCTAFWKPLGIISWSKTSRPLNIQIQELFLPPVLTFSPSWPIEGYPVTLNCETRLPPQRSYVQLQFCFFKDGQLLGSGCNSSSKIQLPTMWLEDSGSYRCQAEAVTYNIIKSSSIFKIRVQRIPVSDVNLEIRPPGGLLIEGENLVLICSVAKGTGTITFSWHKDGTSVGKKTQQSLLAELLVPTVKTHNAGRYYCVADNGAPILSNRIQVTVRSLVSRPVLILRTPRDQALVGDMVELHCEALRGSPPIWYQFYHEDVTLGNSSAPNGGGTSFNFSLTEEHSGNYSCEADNGLGPQRSHRVSLKVIVPVSDIVLNLQTPGSQATIGEEVEIYCEALKGSPPILYQFYHDNIPLGVSLAPTEGGASFKFFVTTERAGNYSCEADNGLEPQRSEVITFSIAGPQRSRAGLISAGVIVGLLGVLSLAAVILLYHFRTQRQSDPVIGRNLFWGSLA